LIPTAPSPTGSSRTGPTSRTVQTPARCNSAWGRLNARWAWAPLLEDALSDKTRPDKARDPEQSAEPIGRTWEAAAPARSVDRTGRTSEIDRADRGRLAVLTASATCPT